MDIDFLTDYYENIIKPLEKVIKDEEQKYYSKPLIFRFVICRKYLKKLNILLIKKYEFVGKNLK